MQEPPERSIKFIDPSKQFYSKKLNIADKRKALDFWRWAYSDLIQNITRGIVAEFIVAWAIGADNKPRQPWDSFDLITREDKQIEVKATAYLQAWTYTKKVIPKFVISPKRTWSESQGLAKTASFNADIYVLCYFNEKNRSSADPMNLDQWDFWVLSKSELMTLLAGKQSISVKKLEDKCINSCNFNELKAAISNK